MVVIFEDFNNICSIADGREAFTRRYGKICWFTTFCITCSLFYTNLYSTKTGKSKPNLY